MIPLLPVATVVLALQGAASPPPSRGPSATTAVAQRATTPPVIDGKDNDAVWRIAPVIKDFRQFQPTEDGNPSFATEAKVAYDDHNFYVFVRAFDTHPDSIKKLLARRDVRICCDQIKIMIDSYHDRRTGFEFAVNPGGVKRDYAMYGDDQQEDDAWDGVWEVATQVDSLGWTAEFRIPLSQLRYAHAPSNTFGFAIWRDIDRHGGERVGWPLYRVSRRGFVSQLGDVVGLDGLAAPRRLELAPYAVTKNVPSAGFQHEQKYDAGADIKYGITSNITVDATVNPDFGQVEADPSVVNLTSFETFYQERRPFFVEGTGIFNFGVNCNIVNCNGEGLFYSRRIGHDPSRILGAAKITGRLPGGLTIGAVEGITKRAADSNVTREPFTNYGVLRLSQDFRNGQSGFGFMATAVNRNVDQWTSGLRDRAYVGAVDFRHRFHGGAYELTGSFDLSSVGGSSAAIAATQLNSTHNYQRPDDNVRFDSTRTSLSGDAEEILLTRRNGFIQFQTSYQRRSPGFEINDLGFLLRSDQQGWNTWGSLNWTKPTKLFQRAFWNFNWWQFWTTGGLPTDRAFNTNAHVQIKNQWFLHAGGTIGNLGAIFCDRCARGGPAVRGSHYIAPWAGFGGDQRRVITPFLFVNYFKGDEGHSTSFGASPEIDVRLGSQLRSSASLNLSHNINDTQDLSPTTDVTGTHYRFAHLDQQTTSLSFRVDYTATPTLTVQVYASPFVSKGRWSNLRELSATPRASAYSDRYQPFTGPAPGDFNLKFFNSNLVVRWEYRPGSTLFLVWSQGRDDFEPTMGTRNITGDFRQLFNAYPRNTFLVKASYWLNR
ncbi:MAG: hypothetical protein DMD38_09470 [Gemmatimonadetes bacterium]|nr:MAG: hypothetical protein AUI86_09740 [Gemmatimonadetes bacterium 13_1_40CM_3_66_12]PYP95935.1 MAG: hypothetical protein DMD38_09470 [Gemmatimonadota bacterium]